MTPVRRGSSFLLVACGLLAGLLIANLADSDPRATVATNALAGSPTDVPVGAGDAVPGGDAGAGTDGSGAVATAPGADPGAAGGAGGTAGAGSGTIAPSSAGSPGAAAGSPAPAAGGGATDVGVTAKSVKMGILAPDTGALGALGPSYKTGDMTGLWKALLEEARADGRLPVHGRDIDPVIVQTPVDVTPSAAAASRSHCLQVVQDVKSFAVMSGSIVDEDCIANEFKTPLVITAAQGRDSDPQRRPLVFTLGVAREKGLRNTAAWLLESGVLKGKTLGLYYADDGTGTSRPTLQQHFVSKLEAAGFKIAREVAYTSGDTGRESTHVLQFRTANVDLILDADGVNLVSGPSFMNAAQSSNYRPKYVEVGVSTTSTYEAVSSNFNTDQWEGTLALVDDARSVEFGGQGRAALGPGSAKCIDTVKRRRNESIDPISSSASWTVYHQTCDLLNVTIEALKQAGPNLTRASFTAALTRIQQGPPTLGWFAPGGFGRENNWTRQVRMVKYTKNCTFEGRKTAACWLPQGGYRPFWVQ